MDHGYIGIAPLFLGTLAPLSLGTLGSWTLKTQVIAEPRIAIRVVVVGSERLLKICFSFTWDQYQYQQMFKTSYSIGWYRELALLRPLFG